MGAFALPLYRVLTLGMGLPSADTLPEAGPARAYQDDDEDSRTLRSGSYVAQEWYVCMHPSGAAGTRGPSVTLRSNGPQPTHHTCEERTVTTSSLVLAAQSQGIFQGA